MRLLFLIALLGASGAAAQSLSVIVADTHQTSGGIGTTPVQNVAGNIVSSGTTETTTISTPSANNLLILTCVGNGVVGTITSITGTVTTDGNGWRLADKNTTNREAEIYYGIAGGTGTTVIANFSAGFGGVNYGCNVSEWTGANTTNALDVHAPASGSSGTSTTGTVTPAASGDVCVAASRVGNSPSGPSGYTALTFGNASFSGGYKVPATTSESTSWTFTSATWGNVISCFKP